MNNPTTIINGVLKRKDKTLKNTNETMIPTTKKMISFDEYN